MSPIQSIVNILQDLGCGLSVQTLITKHNITYDELCNLASQNEQLKQQLYKWYPKYNFEVNDTVKQTKLNEGENAEVPTRKQIRKRKTTRTE